VPTRAAASGEEIQWVWKERFDDVFPERLAPHADPALRQRQTLVLCNHCDDPPCVRVCPTGATFKRSDGPVVMDQHRCIGCRYCIVGCPYGARSFNWSDPRPRIEDIDPDYPTRSRGVVEKCTLCPERLARGQPPACVEACAAAGAGAIVFGDLEDPDSEIRAIVGSEFTLRRKPELGTDPQVYYKP
jgi:molybdopterin-containing oxidoreductase family iron-sulfur binding subunit